MKRLSIIIGAAFLVACTLLFAQDVDKFLRASDGEIVGILALGKRSMSVSGTIEQITWTGKHGASITLRFDGTNLTCMGETLLTVRDWKAGISE